MKRHRDPVSEIVTVILRLQMARDEIRERRSRISAGVEQAIEEAEREIIRNEWDLVRMYCERLARVAREEAER